MIEAVHLWATNRPTQTIDSCSDRPLADTRVGTTGIRPRGYDHDVALQPEYASRPGPGRWGDGHDGAVAVDETGPVSLEPAPEGGHGRRR